MKGFDPKLFEEDDMAVKNIQAACEELARPYEPMNHNPWRPPTPPKPEDQNEQTQRRLKAAHWKETGWSSNKTCCRSIFNEIRPEVKEKASLREGYNQMLIPRASRFPQSRAKSVGPRQKVQVAKKDAPKPKRMKIRKEKPK